MKRELIYAAAVGGCVGALMTMALGLLVPLGAQSPAKHAFGEVTCTEPVVLRPDGMPAVRLSVDNDGGRVGVFGKGNNGVRVGIGVNEYGNGAVTTWGKNGYRLASLK